MNRQCSIYLDLVRFLAALAVFIGHFPNKGFSGHSVKIIDFGHSAVMLFFVLSGYIIAYVSERDKTFKIFALNRIARLYSVVVPAIFLTCILYFIGNSINHIAYENVRAIDRLFIRIICNLFFLQGIHGYTATLINNGPFWSLANEFWYYCLFASFYYAKKIKIKCLLIVLITIIVGWDIISLFPIWLLGVIVYKVRNNVKIESKAIAWSIFTISLILFYFFVYRRIDHTVPLIHDYIVGIIFALHIFSIQFIKISFPNSVEKLSHRLASFTFSLYLFHLPILYFISAIIDYNKNSVFHISLIIVFIIMLVYILSLFTEHKKKEIKILINNSIVFFQNVLRNSIEYIINIKYLFKND